MPTDHRAALANIKTFPQLIAYLRDEMGWPIARDSFEEVDDLFYDFTADELGIDPKTAAKITEIKRLRPLSTRQPWGIFFVKFEPKKLPVVALRRTLSQVALKKRASANSAERTAWAADDLLFVSNYGEGSERQISFAHFAKPQDGHDLPTLKVLGWDNRDTALHLDAVAKELTQHLAWPDDDTDVEAWRKSWRGAFTLRHGEVVTTSKELSIRLAELARNIRDRIKATLDIETDKGPLTKLMKAFQTSLVHDLDADGFADMYAQTIAYGLLSARIADPHKKTVDDFAGHMRTNPFLRELMETFLKVGGRRGKAGGPGIDFDELGVSEVVELLDDANMEAVVLDFGDKNPQEDPVIHFYELFLKEYDAKKRMQRGVFYTPRPVVSYIVRSVDELLRTEFGLEDGLADTTTWGEMAKRHKDLKIPEGTSPDQVFVQILDPATGTGTFLVEVIDIIHKTMVAKWRAQGHGEKKIASLWNEYVPKHLLPRLHAYELLMAPYAIAHLKVGLKLYETGYRFDSDERARIYLTNALEPASDIGQQTLAGMLPALAHEAEAVNQIKRKQRFTVVIGNPPYSGVSSNMSADAQRIVDAYKTVDGEALNERKLWLQDDYVKFIRTSQVIIASSGVGILGVITNHGFLDNPTFRGMRQSLRGTFQRLAVLNLRGNTNKKERSPDGTKDDNVFDIRQGVSICLAVSGVAGTGVRHADVWGSRESKYAWLTTHSQMDTPFTALTPDSPFYFFVPYDVDYRAEYDCGWRIPDIFPLNTVGFVTARDALTIQHTSTEMWDTVRRFGALGTEAARKEFALGADARDWRVATAQGDVRASGPTKALLQPVLYRPFDVRFTYYTGKSRGFYASPCNNVMKQMTGGQNLALCFCRREELPVPYSHFLATRLMANFVMLSGKATGSQAPLYIQEEVGNGSQHTLYSVSRQVNLGGAFLRALAASLRLRQASDGLPIGLTPEDVFNYLYAVCYSRSFRIRYGELLKAEFPRIPLTSKRDLFDDLVRLGSILVSLHLMEVLDTNPPSVTYVGPQAPEVKRAGWSQNTVWLDAGKTEAREGHRATDEGTMGFEGVSEEVWLFHVGGYQVCHKWLKDRKGRTLSKDDIAHYQKIVVALAETIRLMKEIDEVIEEYGGWPGAFQGAVDGEAVPLKKVAEERKQPYKGKRGE